MRGVHTRRTRCGIVLSFLGLFLMLVSGSMPIAVRASQATPSIIGVNIKCDVTPRPLDDMLSLLRPETEDSSAIEPQPLPPGTPADSTTLAEITLVVREMEACANAGDQYRFLSLYSDSLFQKMPRSDQVVDELTTIANSTPTPPPAENREMLIGPWHVHVLPDGRVIAAVLFSFAGEPKPDPTHTKIMIFVRQEGRWLIESIDELIWSVECNDLVRAAAVVGPPPDGGFESWPAKCAEENRKQKRNGERSGTPAALDENG